MSQYRFLQPAYINNRLYSAGETASTSDVGGTLLNFKLPCAVEPLDAAAVTAFFNAGVQPLGQIPMGIAPPTTYWKGTPLGAVTRWQLTGLGAAMSPIFM